MNRPPWTDVGRLQTEIDSLKSDIRRKADDYKIQDLKSDIHKKADDRDVQDLLNRVDSLERYIIEIYSRLSALEEGHITR